MRIHKEGHHMIIVSVLIAAVIITAVMSLPFAGPFLQWALIGFPVILASLIIWFFRAPARRFGSDSGIVFCPADGRVVVIEEVHEEEYFREKRIQVSVFMSPLDAHVNYVPFSGQVMYYKYHEGRYLVAFHPKSSVLNERSSIVLGDGNREIMIRQIAGAVARRIVSYCSEGKQMRAGEEIGFIKFGSRVDLLLPADAEILVSIDQPVRAGMPLARLY